MARGRIRLEWDQTSLVCWTLAEINRDSSKQPEPFDRMMFHPFEETADERSDGPDMALWNKVTQNVPVVRLNHARISGSN